MLLEKNSSQPARLEGSAHPQRAVANDIGSVPAIIRSAAALIRVSNGQEAITLLREALARFGPSSELFYSLAIAHRALHDVENEISSYQNCVQLQPLFAEAHNNLGTAMDRMGRVKESICSFRAALEARPNYVRALTNLGNALRKDKQFALAIETLRQALALAPEYPPALCNLGQIMLDQRRMEEAINLYQRALAVQPDIAQAHSGLGTALLFSGEYQRALVSHDHAISLAPDLAEVHLYRARSLEGLDRHREALASCERALKLKPEWPEAWHCRGRALGRLARFNEAIDSYQRALALAPDHASSRWNQALLRLKLGDLTTGWKLFESRLDLNGSQEDPRCISCRQWRGELSIRGRTIWVSAEDGEHGLGDTIQFSRYVNLLVTLGARVIFEVPPALRSLIGTLASAPEVIAQGEPVERADYQCPLMSLPFALGTDSKSIPAERAYLRADVARTARWADQIPEQTFRVGICWRGNTKHDQAELNGRSMRLQQLQALSRVPRICLVSLQKGPGQEEVMQVDFGEQIVHFGASLDPGPDAFLDTAAIMMNLDLVISVDTSVAHLAGALGVPVWVALHTPSDWRWQLDRDDSPWYPSMRLFRQRIPGDWTSVVEQIALELTRVANATRSSHGGTVMSSGPRPS